jgi:cell division protein FtsZ
MVRPGLINLDFADVRAVMDEMGKAMMGTGEAEGEDRAIQAAEKAIANPLLDEISLRGAKGVLINITGSHDLTLFELDEAANRIREEVDPEANIIVGSTLDPSMEGMIRVSVVATGIDATKIPTDLPVPRRPLAQPLKQTVSAEDHRRSASKPMELTEPVAAMAEAAEAPSLFGGFEAERAAADEQFEDIFEDDGYDDGHEDEELGEDGLPLAAYRPEPEPEEDVAEVYVAPQAPKPGSPSPEAMDRLRVAVENNPKAAHRAAAAAPEKSRFGFNRLIDRMTGHASDTPSAGGAQPARQQPSVRQHAAPSRPDAESDPDQERIEIPAFLRRQAN